MSKEKMQHCFWCGAELGVYVGYYRDIEVCGKPECVREARAAERQEREEAQFSAEQDDYGRYR
jgi:hypothetical protein